MSLQAVQWILVVNYNATAHRAVYGRLSGEPKYSKDYIQLPRRQKFIADLGVAFPSLGAGAPSTPITYRWPAGHTDGTLFSESADRPHLAWGTNKPPAAWRMALAPSQGTDETILGDPTFNTAIQADGEFTQIALRGFGQPYLIAVKLFGMSNTLHIRVQVDNPSPMFQWADLGNAPALVRDLALSTTPTSAVRWHLFDSPQDPAMVFFDPAVKGNPWSTVSTSLPGRVPTPSVPPPGSNQSGNNPGAIPLSSAGSQGATAPLPGGVQPGGNPSLSSSPGANAQHSNQPQGAGGQSSNVSQSKTVPQPIDRDALAEDLESSDEEVKEFEDSIDAGDFEVPDKEGWSKTRGSAQRAFAKRVKDNYGWRCALTGISSREFLIASHIVPWSVDKTIRLDPTNGICLSVLVDRAFEYGYICIDDDFTVHILPSAIAGDAALEAHLRDFDGATLRMPGRQRPNPDYLRRRREL